MEYQEKLANKRQRKPKEQSRMENPEKLSNKRERKPNGAIKNGISRETGK